MDILYWDKSGAAITAIKAYKDIVWLSLSCNWSSSLRNVSQGLEQRQKTKHVHQDMKIDW